MVTGRPTASSPSGTGLGADDRRLARKGAVVVERAERSLEPLDQVSAELITLVEAARGRE